jgi:hypothetical protein
MSEPPATARLAKNAPQQKRYIMDLPKGIDAPGINVSTFFK